MNLNLNIALQYCLMVGKAFACRVEAVTDSALYSSHGNIIPEGDDNREKRNITFTCISAGKDMSELMKVVGGIAFMS